MSTCKRKAPQRYVDDIAPKKEPSTSNQPSNSEIKMSTRKGKAPQRYVDDVAPKKEPSTSDPPSSTLDPPSSTLDPPSSTSTPPPSTSNQPCNSDSESDNTSSVSAIGKKVGRPHAGGPLEANKRYRQNNLSKHNQAERYREYRHWVKLYLNEIPIGHSLYTSLTMSVILYRCRHRCPLDLEEFIYHTLAAVMDHLPVNFSVETLFCTDEFKRVDAMISAHYIKKNYSTTSDPIACDIYDKWFVKNKKSFYETFVHAGALVQWFKDKNTTPSASSASASNDLTSINAAATSSST